MYSTPQNPQDYVQSTNGNPQFFQYVYAPANYEPSTSATYSPIPTNNTTALLASSAVQYVTPTPFMTPTPTPTTSSNSPNTNGTIELNNMTPVYSNVYNAFYTPYTPCISLAHNSPVPFIYNTNNTLSPSPTTITTNCINATNCSTTNTNTPTIQTNTNCEINNNIYEDDQNKENQKPRRNGNSNNIGNKKNGKNGKKRTNYHYTQSPQPQQQQQQQQQNYQQQFQHQQIQQQQIQPQQIQQQQQPQNENYENFVEPNQNQNQVSHDQQSLPQSQSPSFYYGIDYDNRANYYYDQQQQQQQQMVAYDNSFYTVPCNDMTNYSAAPLPLQTFSQNVYYSDEFQDFEEEKLACRTCRGKKKCFCYFIKVGYHKFPSYVDFAAHQSRQMRYYSQKSRKM